MNGVKNPRARILVVDDAGEILILCVNMVQSLGYVARLATSGEAAVDLLRREPFDLAIVDYRMPGMDGFETFGRMREIRPNLACVLLTGYGTAKVIVEAKAMGFAGVLFKPFNLRQLRSVIETALAARRGIAGAEA